VLQEGASLCILFAAAFTASIPPAFIALADCDCVLPAGEALPITLTSLNSGFLSPIVGDDSFHVSSPKFPASGLSST
jgi:hypothetical protein